MVDYVNKDRLVSELLEWEVAFKIWLQKRFLLQGGDAGGLGGVKHSGAGGCHQEASP